MFVFISFPKRPRYESAFQYYFHTIPQPWHQQMMHQEILETQGWLFPRGNEAFQAASRPVRQKCGKGPSPEHSEPKIGTICRPGEFKRYRRHLAGQPRVPILLFNLWPSTLPFRLCVIPLPPSSPRRGKLSWNAILATSGLFAAASLHSAAASVVRPGRQNVELPITALRNPLLLPRSSPMTF